jgi:predicted nucleotidyltransferase
MKLQIEERHWEILQNILRKYPYNFYAYGSRVKGISRKFSDLDICYQEDIPLNTLAHLEADLEKSDLPIIVELVDWKRMNPDF